MEAQELAPRGTPRERLLALEGEIRERVYEREIRPRLDRDHDGRFLIVDVRTGRFEIADDELTAFDRAGQDNPDGLLFGLRVGSRAAHRLGGRPFAAG